MSIEFKLPELGENIEKADVAEVLVSEGDVISADQVVVELETDKAVVELPCPHAGKVSRVHVKAGESVKVGAPIVTIEADGGAKEDGAEQKAEEKEKPAPKEKEKKEEEPAEPAARQPEAKEDKPAKAEPAPQPARPAAAKRAEGEVPPPAGPATRRLARELGVDLRQVSGSGPGGRITIEDVQAYVRNLTSGGAAPAAGGVSVPPLPDFSKFGKVERQAQNKIAKVSAAGLSVSWQVIPHVTQHDLADITELEAVRRRFVEKTARNGGPKVTMTAIAVKAAVAMLRRYPTFNSSLDASTNELIIKHYYNIGVAVDTPHGLLVPVIHNADQMTTLEIAGEITRLAELARDRKLDIKEMQGATFTITNLGGIGGTAFTPIVNYPEVAILGMSRSRKELQLVNGQPAERLMLPLSLSYDHRVVNGADAARFVSGLVSMFSDAFHLLAES